ncbi:uncharacterized protein SRS1_12734 [Sporisorium reilianum f. sp. reilianum]|uniref:C2H2-type domain-containing protein n=1 Tax=Sporisorium reilianum f. sp. reilianum TaxID=72559 RepID=A0A2N8UAK1_9BASI|nr:uncharacterized protein SRS1_12734 [Sporisorium reilianum f. sp. reilianum]
MSAFTLSPSGITSFGPLPTLDAYTKSVDSTTTTTTNTQHLGELQRFLSGSDWSALSSLSPPTAPVDAVVVDSSSSWPAAAAAADTPLFPSSVDTVKPNMQTVAAAVAAASWPILNPAAAVDSVFDAVMSASTPAAAATTPSTPPAAPYPSPLTPVHRHSFDTCYTDSVVGSPDSDRDFLVSPSLFDDADFEFEGDALANTFPLFTDQAFEDPTDADVEDSVSATASNLENVKLEAEADHHEEPASQQTESDFESSQSTVMPSQSQVKLEEQDDHESFSTLAAAFKTEPDAAKLEPKHEHELWSAEELKPYFSDEDTKFAVLSTLANAFACDASQPVKDFAHSQDGQRASNVGPIRRERRSSPNKATTSRSSGSPAPIIDPITKAKRWQCHECGKWFDRAYNLKTHRYTHEDPNTRARPFVCPDVDCQKQFARKHDMQRHFENVHRGESRRLKGGLLKRSRADDLG